MRLETEYLENRLAPATLYLAPATFSGAPGSTLTEQVILDNPNQPGTGGMVAFDFGLAFTPGALTITSIDMGPDLPTDWVFSPNSPTSGIIGVESFGNGMVSDTVVAPAPIVLATLNITLNSVPSQTVPLEIVPMAMTTSGNVPTAIYGLGGAFTLNPAPSNSFIEGVDAVITISPTAILILSPSTLPNADVGAAYSQTITSTNGTSPFTFTTSAGTLPAGLMLSTTGVLSGTPTATGTFIFTVQGTDSAAPANTGTMCYTVTINPAVTITTTILPNDTVGVLYDQTIIASGGGGTYTFSTTSGTLPTGLTLASNGLLNGTPSAAGSFTFTVTASDALGSSASQVYSVTISPPVVIITLSPSTLPDGEVGVANNPTIAALGGTAPYTYATTAGTLPTGLTLSPAGILRGTPSAAGKFTFTIMATDSAAHSGSQNYAVTIHAAMTITTTTLPNFLVGTAYSRTISASGGSGPYTFSETSGNLPYGMTLSSSAVLSGTPSAAGNFIFTVSASDALGGRASQTYTVTIMQAQASYDVVKDFSINANPNGPWSYLQESGSTLAPLTNIVNGLNGVAGVYSWWNGENIPNSVSIYKNTTASTVNVSDSIVQPPTLLGMDPESATAAVTRWTAPATGTWSISGLFQGIDTHLYFSHDVEILENSSTVLASTAISSYGQQVPFSKTVTLNQGDTIDFLVFTGASYMFLSDGLSATITLSSFPLPSGDVATPYSQTIPASGGTAPYTFATTSGTLPTGLTLHTDGVLAGTPTAAGSFSFTVTATDSTSHTISQNYAVTINPALAISSTTLPNGLKGTAYSQTITASGGTAPVTFATTAGNLPTGLILSSVGVLSGSPTTAGSYSFAVTATDTEGASASEIYSLTIGPGPLSEYVVTVQGSSTVQAGKGFLVSMQAADQFGNPITSYSGPSSVMVSISPANASSHFPTGVAINSTGLGLFLTDLQKVGTYTISVASGALTGSASPVTVTPGPPVQLDFVAEPTDTPSFLPLPPVTVQVDDLYGNVVTTDNSDLVTVGVASGPASLTPCSTPTVMVQNGVATFSNLKIIKPGTYELSATVPGLYTGPFSASFSVLPLEVVPGSFVTSPSGFSVSFNTPFLVNATTPVLYGKGVGTGAPVPTVTLTGPSGPVAGTLVVNSASNALTFVATDTTSNVIAGTPILPAGVYTAVIHGTAAGDGLRALHSAGGFLNNGSDFTATFTVGAITSDVDVLWMPATADGPRQSLQAPGNNQENQPGLLASGYPIYIHDTTGLVTSVNLTFNYNPAQITVTGATSNSAVPGSTFTLLGSSTPGHAILQYAGPPSSASKLLKETTIPAALGDVPLGFINATVPVSSQAQPIYGAADLLSLTGVAVNPTTMNPGGSIPSLGAEAVHLVAYVGDADGNGAYSSTDAMLIRRVVDQVDTGFAAYPLVDPVVVADTDGSGFIPSDAALQGNEAGVAFPTASLALPPVPRSGLAITTPLLPNGDVGLAYSQTIGTAGGTPYVFFSWTGSLPTGLTLSSTGVLSGTPMVEGTFAFTVRATDSATPTPANASLSYTITINPPVTNTMLPAGEVRLAYSQTLTVQGETPPITFTMYSGTLPPGLTLSSSSGVLSGTPTAPGSFTFTIMATDSAIPADTVSQNYTVTIMSPLAITTTSLPNGNQGAAYSQTINTTGGMPPMTFFALVGTLPTGLTLNGSTGVLSGTPTTSSIFTFIVTVVDTLGGRSAQAYTVSTMVCCGPPLSPPVLPNGEVALAYSQTISVSYATPPLLFSVSSGTLPTGLTLSSSTGVLSGTPTATGSFTFTLMATDSAIPADTATQSYTVTINPQVRITMTSLPNGSIGTAYSQTISVAGGSGPYTFSTSTGTLPTGLTLNSSTGVLSGTLTASGTFTFTITVTDSLGGRASQSYTSGGICCGYIMLSPTMLPNGEFGAAYSQTISATGGTGPYTFTTTAGTLPTGLTLSPFGILNGTPSATGTFTFTVSATDSTSDMGSQTYTVTISPAVAITTTALANGTVGVAYSQTIAAMGGSGSYMFSSTGTLPTGLTLNSSIGVLSGTPSATGTFSFTVTATNALGGSASQAYTVTIVALVGKMPSRVMDPVALDRYFAQTTVARPVKGSLEPLSTSGWLAENQSAWRCLIEWPDGSSGWPSSRRGSRR